MGEYDDRAERMARTWSAVLAAPVGMAGCGCPNNLLGAPPLIHLCRRCGNEGGWSSVHGPCAECAREGGAAG